MARAITNTMLTVTLTITKKTTTRITTTTTTTRRNTTKSTITNFTTTNLTTTSARGKRMNIVTDTITMRSMKMMIMMMNLRLLTQSNIRDNYDDENHKSSSMSSDAIED